MLKALKTLKKKYPGTSISVLKLHKIMEFSQTMNCPYKELADQYYVVVRKVTKTDKAWLFHNANELDCKGAILEATETDKKVWFFHMYVGENTDMKKFSKLFLFACDHLRWTIPIVHMTKKIWDNKIDCFPETKTRLLNNIYF